MALFNESGVSEGLDLDMALLIDSDNELMGYVPDTPSPVFNRMRQTRHSPVRTDPMLDKAEDHRRVVLDVRREPSTHRDITTSSPSPSSSRSVLPSQRRQLSSRTSAMNRLRLKRDKNTEKKKTTPWLKSDSDDDDIHKNVKSLLVKYDEEHQVIPESSDSDSEPLHPFDVGVVDNDDVICGDVKTDGIRTPNQSTKCQSDDSDIDDEDLEAFVNGLMLDTCNNSMDKCDRHAHAAGIGTSGATYLKRKSHPLNSYKSPKRHKSSVTSCMSRPTLTDDSLIMLDNSSDEPNSPTSVLNTLVNSPPVGSPKRDISRFFVPAVPTHHSRRLRSTACTSTATSSAPRSDVSQSVTSAPRSDVSQSVTSAPRSDASQSVTSAPRSDASQSVTSAPGLDVDVGAPLFPGGVFSVPTRSPRRRCARSGTGVMRRRGIRPTTSPGCGSADRSLLVSPATRRNNQLAEDEAMARKLQEEMDREFAATLMETPEPVMHAIYGEDLSVSSPSPPRSDTRTSNSVLAADRAGNNSTPRQPVRGSGLDYDSHMYMRIGQMTDYEWRVHQSTSTGRSVPAAPSRVNTAVNEILDPEVLQFIDHHQYERSFTSTAPVNRGVNELSPVRPTRRTRRSNTRAPANQRAVPAGTTATTREEESLDYETAMLMRIGGLTEPEWDHYQASYHGLDVSAENRRTNNDVDNEIINFMQYRNNRQTYTPPAAGTRRGTTRRGGRRRRGRNLPHDYMANSFDANDYETLLNLAESIGDAKPKGLTEHQVTMLPTKQYKVSEARDDSLKECSICMVDYEEEDSLRLLQCFHYFHATCIDRWLMENASCPICRVQVQFD